jgi:hypothetical protein
MESVGVTVKLTVPDVVGVPERVIVPVPLPEMVRPVVFVSPDTPRVTGSPPGERRRGEDDFRSSP